MASVEVAFRRHTWIDRDPRYAIAVRRTWLGTGNRACSGPTGPATLYHISPTTGAATAIGPIGFARVGSLDFSPIAGKLYGVGSNGGSAVLITINPSTGAGTQVGPLGFIAGGGIYDIAFRPLDGRLFALRRTRSRFKASSSETVLARPG